MTDSFGEYVVQVKPRNLEKWYVVETDFETYAKAHGRMLALAISRAQWGGEWRVAKANYIPTHGKGDQGFETSLSALAYSFAAALAAKLMASEAKYNWNNGWMHMDRESLLKRFHEHIAKGDPIDVAAYCAFAWYHAWPLEKEPNDQG